MTAVYAVAILTRTPGQQISFLFLSSADGHEVYLGRRFWFPIDEFFSDNLSVKILRFPMKIQKTEILIPSGNLT